MVRIPWKLVHNHPACRSGEWAVVNQQAEAEGRHSIEGCHGTRAEALAQQRALYANEPQASSHEGQMMERKTLVAPVEWKTVSGDPGALEGYLSVFGNIDEGGDVVLPGAFKKTLAHWQQSGRKIPLLVDHKLSTDGVVGSIDHAREDQVGVKVRASFSSITKAQDIRTLMLEGHLGGMSFTYEPRRSRPGMKDGQKVRYLEEVRLFEGTITPFPMNTLAMASAKAAVAALEHESADQDAAAAQAVSGAGAMRLDFEAFTTAMGNALAIEFAPARKAAVEMLVAAYTTQPDAAGPATAQPDGSTALDAAPTEASSPPASPAPGSSVPFSQLTPREHVQHVLERVEQADGSPASLDELEARIRRSLEGAS